MNEHQFIPPSNLVAEWFYKAKAHPPDAWVTEIANQAADWGASRQLEMCTGFIKGYFPDKPKFVDVFTETFNRKYLSLKEQAFEAHHRLFTLLPQTKEDMVKDFEIIRRALEQLDD